MIPIKVGGVVVAAAGFGALFRERSWPAQISGGCRRWRKFSASRWSASARYSRCSELRNELAYISRINTLGELAASLAHEINQPLAAIRSNAEAIQSMLEAEVPDLDEVKAAVADIVSDDARAGDTIQPPACAVPARGTRPFGNRRRTTLDGRSPNHQERRNNSQGVAQSRSPPNRFAPFSPIEFRYSRR